MKKFLTLAGEVKMIFEVQDVNLSVNNFWSFFQIWDKVLPKELLGLVYVSGVILEIEGIVQQR